MICPFHDGKSGEPTCTKKCPFYDHDEEYGYERCNLAADIGAFTTTMYDISHRLEGIRLELVGLRLAIEKGVGIRESEGKDDREAGRAGEEARGGDAEEAEEGGDDGSGSAGVQAVLQAEGEAEEGTKESEAGRDGAEEPNNAEVLADENN